ncbi:hypothetical protein EDD75_0754 [Thermodesulfitimonas autotrophica]|uniref:DUF5320 domain-containing protein n=1 Tax=Thermodesulfitimonas autotrophica TaxID=1894989 RepID=A0A3N5BJS2_9THEO|nr:DUF5320 domain-containing protein [Thermodesulfitimonas autotrophica]RPF49928.1 hypothetical protein EDD75_0754 [Thermodesulfitimonas autotrophica]
MPWGYGYGFGRGFGFGRWHAAPWCRRRFWGAPYWYGFPEEKEFLKNEASFLRQQLEAIEKRLQELQKQE